MHRYDLRLALEFGRLRINLCQSRMPLVNAPRIQRRNQPAIQRMRLRHAAHLPPHDVALVADPAFPAGLRLFRQLVEPRCE